MKWFKLLLFSFLFFPLTVQASPIYHPWDKNVKYIRDTIEKKVPVEFNIDNSNFLIETISWEDYGILARIYRVSGWDGLYMDSYISSWDKGPQIYLSPAVDETNVEYIICHEIGHWVHDRLLTPEEHIEYTKLYIQLRDSSRLATEYSKTNEDEGAAESFRLFCFNDKGITQEEKTFWIKVQNRLKKIGVKGYRLSHKSNKPYRCSMGEHSIKSNFNSNHSWILKKGI